MKKLFDYIGSGIGLIFSLFFFYAEIFGIIHSVKHHSTKDVVATVFLPPWAWWRSIEMYWHDDNANVDWNKRLNADLRSCVYFLTEGSYKEANQFELNENMEEFTSKIKGYPKEKKKYLMDGCRQYVSYTLLATKDIASLMDEYYDTGKFSVSFSSETNKVKSDLMTTYKLQDLIDPLEKVMNEQAKQMSSKSIDNLTTVDKEEIKTKFHSQMNFSLSKGETDMKRIFKNIFNEKL